MTGTQELISQINENPRLLAKINIIEETNAFDRNRLRDIIEGLENARLIDAFIRLTVNKWNSLEARHDSRLYEDDSVFGKRLKFTGEEYYDQDGNRYEDSIDNYLYNVKSDELRARELEAKELRDQEEILTELGLLDDDESKASTDDMINVDSISDRLLMAERKLNKIEGMMSATNEQEAKVLENRKATNELFEKVRLLIEDDYHDIAKENAELRTQVDELTQELKDTQDELNDLLHPEPIELTDEEIAEFQRQEEEFREYEKEQFDKALQEATDELEKKSIKITVLTKRVLDIPDYTEQLQHFRVLSFLLAGNKAWQQVEGSLVDQINAIANERKQQQPIGKLADLDGAQINLITGDHAEVCYQKVGKQEEQARFPLHSTKDEGIRKYDALINGVFMEVQQDSWLFLMGFVEQKPQKVRAIKWLGTKEQLRQMLRMINEDLLSSKSITIADIERLTPKIFIDKDCKPLELAKSKQESSLKMDELVKNFRPSPTSSETL